MESLNAPGTVKYFSMSRIEKWENKLQKLKVMKVKWDENRGRNFWRPMHRNKLLNSTNIEIVR